MIDVLSDEELFLPHMRKWADEATKTAVWEVYKFIHVNTVAPFGTFRTKIRKWKKMSTMKLSSVTWQTILISTILSGYVPAYKVQSWISSHIRKSTMDMFPQREL